MASSTPSELIISSRGAADTTTGRIYFSTPSAQVRVALGDLVVPPPPPPHTSAHTILLGGKLSGGGVKTIRRRNNYPGWAQVGQKFEKNSKCPKLSHSAENTLFHIFIHWAKLYPIFIHWTELYPIFKHWIELYPILIHCRTVPYLNTLSWTISYFTTLNRTVPYLNTLPICTLSEYIEPNYTLS